MNKLTGNKVFVDILATCSRYTMTRKQGAGIINYKNIGALHRWIETAGHGGGVASAVS
jgi:hypothetical protein